MKVLITRYALTKGIIENDAEIIEGNALVRGGSFMHHFHGEGREWHRTEESAKQKAELMRVKKIHSLKKQIKKLEGMKF